MIIRKATLNDADFIATYLLLAMESIIYKFISKDDYEEARRFLLHFVGQEQNQYSYQNCIVAEIDDTIVAALNYYEGQLLYELREPVLTYVRDQYNPHFNPEPETQPGEYYIDSFGVEPTMQGKGIGAQLLQHLIDHYVIEQHQTLGLLVDEENPKAKKLYLKLGFTPVGTKTLVGQHLEHLQLKPRG